MAARVRRSKASCRQAGSLRSSGDDMVSFLAACLQQPDGALGAALRFAQQPQARISKELQVGLFWFIVTCRDRLRVVWHKGGTWAFGPSQGSHPNRELRRWSCRTPPAVSTAPAFAW